MFREKSIFFIDNIIWSSHTHKQKHLDKMQFGSELKMFKSLCKFWGTGEEDRKDQSVPSVQVVHSS